MKRTILNSVSKERGENCTAVPRDTKALIPHIRHLRNATPNKLISSERLSKILQKETKIIKIGQAVLEIFNFEDRDLDNFTRK